MTHPLAPAVVHSPFNSSFVPLHTEVLSPVHTSLYTYNLNSLSPLSQKCFRLPHSEVLPYPLNQEYFCLHV